MTGSPRTQAEQTSQRDQLSNRRTEVESFRKTVDNFAYSLFGEYFDSRREDFDTLQVKLEESQYGLGADLYLSRLSLYSLSISIVTTLFLLGLIGLLQMVALGEINLALMVPTDPLGYFLADWPVVQALLISIPLYLCVLGATAIGIYLWPWYLASERRRRLDRTMPYAVTFMYALSRGGMNIVEIFEVLADADDTYGEVAKELQPLVRDIDYFSRDLPFALRRAGRRSPSEKFENFADDMVSVLDSGADLTGFFSEKADTYLEEAKHEQKNFIETLELLGEVYVTAFVAGPLFLIIITVVMSMLGGASSTQLDGIVYALLPIMNVVFFLLIDTISTDDGDLSSAIDTENRAMTVEEIDDLLDEIGGDDRVQSVRDAKQKRERTELVRDPMGVMLRNPDMTLAFTAPLALLFVGGVIGTGIVELTFEQLLNSPIETTVLVFLGPFWLMALPLSVFYEISARREKKMMNRLPGALKQLASANEIGMTLTESLANAAENTSGNLGEEFSKVRNDIEWKHDINGALIAFANRVHLPIVARTVKLITEANQSTGDIADVLDVAARDVSTRQRLRKERNSAMMMYTAVILISFAVYLFVIWLLDSTFLSKIAEIGKEASNNTTNASSGGASGGAGPSGPGGGSGQGGGFQLSNLPIKKYEMVFYHSTLVQGIGSGLLSGTLKDNDPRAGLKFVLVLTAIATGAFYFL